MNRGVAGILIALVLLSGCSQTSTPRDGTESGPARLGDIQLENKNNVSVTIEVRVRQNDSTVYYQTRNVSVGTEPMVLGSPNVTGEFLVEGKYKEKSEWNQIDSTSDGLKTEVALL